MNSESPEPRVPSRHPPRRGLDRISPAEDLFAKLVHHFNCIGHVELAQAQWKNDPDSLDYVCVDTKRMIMEKSRYVNRAADLSGVRIRFWLKEHATIVDMHFTPQLVPVGWFMPVTTGFEASSFPFQTAVAFVGIAVSARRKIIVTGEQALRDARANDVVSEAQRHVWLERLRHLRYEFMARRYPPAIVRNFTLVA